MKQNTQKNYNNKILQKSNQAYIKDTRRFNNLNPNLLFYNKLSLLQRLFQEQNHGNSCKTQIIHEND